MTRKHSSKMRIARLTTTHALSTRCQYWQRGPQMNKFEQVSSVGHQMSLAGGEGWEGGMSDRGAGVGAIR